MLNTGEVNGAILLIFLIGLALFIFSIYTGRQLLNKETLKYGIVLSIINQIFQIIQFKMAGYGFSFSSGGELLVGFSNNIKFDFAIINSSFNMSINTDSSEFVFMVNFLAIFFLIVLFDIWEELKTHGENKETHEEATNVKNIGEVTPQVGDDTKI